MTTLHVIEGRHTGPDSYTRREYLDHIAEVDEHAWPQVFSRIPVGPLVWARTQHGKLFHLVKDMTIFRHISIPPKGKMLDMPPHQRPGKPSHIAVHFWCGNGCFDDGVTYHDLTYVVGSRVCTNCVRRQAGK